MATQTITPKNVGGFILDFRNTQAWSQDEIAKELGVSRVTVARWENGKSAPSGLALKRFQELYDHHSDGGEEVLFNQDKKKTNSKKTKTYQIKNGSIVKEILPAPYVLNGPKDQNDFHRLLIEIQQPIKEDRDWETYKSRISLAQEIDGEQTTQFRLESPKHTAKSWNSNYGPHGWHRYVGRFPPHLVRALLNYFGATSDDLVCDPFAGSGTTLVEARLLGIPSVGIEICPLSCMIANTKASFPKSGEKLNQLTKSLEEFYSLTQESFLDKHKGKYTHQDILDRNGNNLQEFANFEKWFTPEAFLGVSIITEFAQKQRGYLREALLTALSAKMRSIGNVDVDVIRAEYSKAPRKNVDVLRLTKNQLLKMARDIDNTLESHQKTIGDSSIVKLYQGSVLDTKFKPGSISHIITSPPYGIESLSYLRTHLLSYRSMGSFLKTDPYEFGGKVIGSEYLEKNMLDEYIDFPIAKISPAYKKFFKALAAEEHTKNHKIRVQMMMKFFQDMGDLIESFHGWLKPGGKIAFVIGNKRINGAVIPTDTITKEIFEGKGFKLDRIMAHKLKTNNSNSKVPWQDRIIDQEFVMIFTKQ